MMLYTFDVISTLERQGEASPGIQFVHTCTVSRIVAIPGKQAPVTNLMLRSPFTAE
jgi:hypothetical protein